MNCCDEYLESVQNRHNLYVFLARMYRLEVDASLLTKLKNLCFASEAAQGMYLEGARQLDDYLRKAPFNARTELAIDYARVFLAAGIATSEAAFPYESVYTSAEHLVMQDAHANMIKALRAKGLAKTNGTTEPADHIAIELDYLDYLVGEGRCAAEAGNAADVEASIDSQLDFMSAHLTNWVPSFVADIERYSQTDFYRGIGKMTLGFLEMDSHMLEALATGDGRVAA